ncbi:MAG: C-terminal binding protein [Bdellovibrionota bacterium]
MRVAVSDRITNPDIEEKILGEKIASKPSKETQVLLVWHEVVNKNYIDSLPNLKYIIRYGVGYDKVDVEYSRSKGILVSNTPDYCTDEVSDTAIAFIMASARGICRYNYEAKSYREGWQENVLTSIKRTSETKLGIIGAGRIGQSTILKAKAMKFDVSFYDPYVTIGTEKVLNVRRHQSLQALLQESDIVSLHVPLTAETKGLVDENFLSQMKAGASLVNTARGGVVKDLDLFIDPLKNGTLSSVFLDVLPKEPDFTSQLFQAWKTRESWINGRVVINPHSAFYSQEAGIEMREKVALNAKKFLNDQKPDALIQELL